MYECMCAQCAHAAVWARKGISIGEKEEDDDDDDDEKKIISIFGWSCCFHFCRNIKRVISYIACSSDSKSVRVFVFTASSECLSSTKC